MLLFHLITILIIKVDIRTGGDTVEKFISVKEVSELFGVTETTVRRWVMENTIPSYLIGGARRFIQSELLEHIKNGDEKQ